MAVETEVVDVEEVLDADITAEQVTEPEGETPPEQEPKAEEAEPDEVVVTIGEEAPPEEAEKAPAWVKDLRKSNREKDRRLREQEAEIARLKGAGIPEAVVVGAKPTLEGCDFDADKFERELEAWQQRKRDVEAKDREKADAEKAQRDAWQAKLEAFGKAKAALKVPDYEDAEAQAGDILSVVQLGVILNGADRPELLIYALGKNPKKAKELASISDPVRFAFAVSKLETNVNVTPKKTAPPPERTITGTKPVTGAVASDLERLRAEAEKTGDMSKVVAHQRAQRAKLRA